MCFLLYVALQMTAFWGYVIHCFAKTLMMESAQIGHLCQGRWQRDALDASASTQQIKSTQFLAIEV